MMIYGETVTVIHGYLNVKLCFHATTQELSAVLDLQNVDP